MLRTELVREGVLRDMVERNELEGELSGIDESREEIEKDEPKVELAEEYDCKEELAETAKLREELLEGNDPEELVDRVLDAVNNRVEEVKSDWDQTAEDSASDDTITGDTEPGAKAVKALA